MNALFRSLNFLVSIGFNLWVWALLLRLVFQKVGVSYFNPIAQALLKLTEWLIKPTRKYLFLRHWRGFDLALIFWLYTFSCLGVWLLVELAGLMNGVSPFVAGAGGFDSVLPFVFVILRQGLVFLGQQVLHLYFFAIIIRAIMSWFPNAVHSPMFPLVCRITDPLLNIFKRVIPPLGGMDFSPLFAIVVLQLINVALFNG